MDAEYVTADDLQEAMDRLQVNQTELARRLRLSRQYVSALLAGSGTPSFHVSLAFLMLCRKHGLNDIATRVARKLDAGDLL